MNITDMIANGAENPVTLFLAALVLGGLHGFEPGHSKTMIAAYIIAVRGTVGQAILLGLSAALSHSAIVWLLAFIALAYGNELIGDQLEPFFMIGSGILVLLLAGWMFFQAWRASAHSHDHDHDHHHAHDHHHHGGHADHDHRSGDAHARAHARQLADKLKDGPTTTWQTVLFGLSGGLVPCPAAITVFLLCLHLGKPTLGIVLVSAFSIGLAIVLMAFGVVAAVGLRAITSGTRVFDRVLGYAPYISAYLITMIGLVMLIGGIAHYQVHLAAQ
ncbi:nickel/cobalt efflux transporter [Agrobacterium vitis]|uniref:nickel/cobalt efflux transporter n=1 Tax=Agrobacterium vitis TaxID=373 RepID=UPI003D2C2116